MEVLGELRVASLPVVGRVDVLISLALHGAASLVRVASIHVRVVVAVDGSISLIATQTVQMLPLAQSVEVVDDHFSLVPNLHLVLVRLSRSLDILLKRAHGKSRDIATALDIFFQHSLQNGIVD